MTRPYSFFRPKHFLGFCDLQHGAELVMMSALINKVSGFFGIFALFTGAAITGLQLSMYFYSLAAVGLILYLAPKLHDRDPLAALAFAYFYLLDTALNALYTVLFGVVWFITLSGGIGIHAAKEEPIATTTTATEVVSAPASMSTGSLEPRQVATAMLQPESATSIFIISVLWAVRVYFVLVAFSYARHVVRASATPADAPFEGQNGGEGWRGRLGRALVGVGRGYWEGDGWMEFGAKFRRSSEPRRRGRGLSLEV